MRSHTLGREVFTTGQAAEICRVSQQTIIRCFDEGKLTGFRVPGSSFRRIPREQLVKFMGDNGIPLTWLGNDQGIPTQIPENGFYYHYKHDPAGTVNNHAYEVIGVGCHTEEEGVWIVVYAPLYREASVYQAGKFFDLRPLGLWMESVEKNGKTIPRFSKITDPVVISMLTVIKRELYGHPARLI